jgi:hypothetical protein
MALPPTFDELIPASHPDHNTLNRFRSERLSGVIKKKTSGFTHRHTPLLRPKDSFLND